MKSTALKLLLIAGTVFGMGACSKGDAPPPATASVAPVSAKGYDTVATTAKGFTVGALMSAQPVYVLFDPQCPHCGELWNASLPLHAKVKFIWVPIAFNSGKSVAQGAALLSAVDPVATMTEHEKSLLGGSGGMSASASISDDLAQAIKTNTSLMTTLGLDAVPYILAKNRRTGEVVSNSGALKTDALAQFLGVD